MSFIKRLYIIKKTDNGYLIKVKKNKNKYIIFDSKGKPEYQNHITNQENHYFQDLIKLVFFGYNVFDESCGKDSNVNFFSVKNSYLQIPYCLKGSKIVNYLPIKVKTNSDIFPIIIYYISSKLDILNFNYQDIYLDFIVLHRYSNYSMKNIFSLNLYFPQSKILILEDFIVNESRIQDSNLNHLQPVSFCRLLIKNSDFKQLKSYLSTRLLTLKEIESLLFYTDKLKENEFEFSIEYSNFLNKCINLFELYKKVLSLNSFEIQNIAEEITDQSLLSIFILLFSYKEKNSNLELDRLIFWLLRLDFQNETI